MGKFNSMLKVEKYFFDHDFYIIHKILQTLNEIN